MIMMQCVPLARGLRRSNRRPLRKKPSSRWAAAAATPSPGTYSNPAHAVDPTGGVVWLLVEEAFEEYTEYGLAIAVDRTRRVVSEN